MAIPVLLTHETARYDPELWRRLEPKLREEYATRMQAFVERRPTTLETQMERFAYIEALRWVLEKADELVRGE